VLVPVPARYIVNVPHSKL